MNHSGTWLLQQAFTRHQCRVTHTLSMNTVLELVTLSDQAIYEYVRAISKLYMQAIIRYVEGFVVMRTGHSPVGC